MGKQVQWGRLLAWDTTATTMGPTTPPRLYLNKQATLTDLRISKAQRDPFLRPL
jgi:hypothetical protein